jgi:hypothetical protein
MGSRPMMHLRHATRRGIRPARRADGRITFLELTGFSIELSPAIGGTCITSPHAVLFRVCGVRGDVSAMSQGALAQ